jgi:predicted nucleic acid-binding protein
MEPVFLDTSFIIALEDADDQNHDRAITFWKGFRKHPRKVITTTYIFDETVTFLKNRMGFAKSAEVGNRLLESSLVEVVHISPDDFDQGWKMFLKFKDKGFSFTDCLSFLVMERKKVKKALAFDEHFQQIGFGLLPE